MPRTSITAQTTPGAYPTLPLGANSRDFTFQPGDVSNGNEVTLVEGKTVVLVKNTDVGATTVTFTSVADTLNRTGDITAYSVGAGEIALFGPFKAVGWAHSGKIWVDVSDVDLQVAALTLP